MENNVLYMSQEELEKLKKLRTSVYNQLLNARRSSAGDFEGIDFFDNTADFVAVKYGNNISALENLLDSIDKNIQRAKIVQPLEDPEQIDIGDTVKIVMYYGPDDYEERTCKLVGYSFNLDLSEITINSPIGQALYGNRAKKGDIINYTVNTGKGRPPRKLSAEILDVTKSMAQGTDGQSDDGQEM